MSGASPLLRPEADRLLLEEQRDLLVQLLYRVERLPVSDTQDKFLDLYLRSLGHVIWLLQYSDWPLSATGRVKLAGITESLRRMLTNFGPERACA